MTHPISPLPERPPFDAWEAAARKALGDAYVALDLDGLAVAALYGPVERDEPAAPGRRPHVRGFTARLGGATAHRYQGVAPEVLLRALAADAGSGVDAAWVPLDPDLGVGKSPSPRLPPVDAGLVCARGEDVVAMGRAFRGEGALVVDAGAAAPVLVDLVADATGGSHEPDVGIEVRADPVAGCLAGGVVPAGLGSWFEALGETLRRAPRGVTLRLAVDGSCFAEAGAMPVTELALATAALAATVEGALAAGIPREQVARVALRVAAGTEVLDQAAKIRALRVLVGGVLDAAELPAHRVRLEGVVPRRLLCTTDVWTNLLRGTLGAAAGLLAGVDAMAVPALDAARGLAGPMGRRLARNTVTILREEAGLGRVVDPLGGSWYVEARTADYVTAARRRCREILDDGGLWETARRGKLARWLEDDRSRAARAVADGGRPIVGVTLHPDPSLAPPADGEPEDRNAALAAVDPDALHRFGAAVRRTLGPVAAVAPVRVQRASAPFEGGEPSGEEVRA